MTWNDPTNFAANAIPTTSGSESANINTKYTSKITQLHNFLVGSDTESYLFKATAGSDYKIQLGGSIGATFFTLLNYAGGTVVKIDDTGQLRGGYLDAEVIAAQFPGTVSIATKVNNVRVLAPYAFTANELAASCDDDIPPSGSSMIWRVVNSSAGTLGSITITAGNSIGSNNITAASITKNTVFTFDCVQKGATNPGQDINIQIRGFRTGTIMP